MRSKTLSVIMPVYNQEKVLAETIKSVLDQTYTDFEFLILDDGSTDASSVIIKQYALQDPRIKIFSGKNSGRAEATNLLMKNAQGIFCALLDADDIMLPNRLEYQLQFHIDNPGVSTTSCHCYYINNKGAQLGIQHYPSLETVEDCNRVRQSGEIVLCAITGLMVKREDYLLIGGLNQKFWPSDDLDFINRLIDDGKNVIILQQALMKYRIHPQSITSRKRWYMFNVHGYTVHCIGLRRCGKPEITFEEYLALIKKNTPRITRIKLKMHQYAIFFHRKAGFNLYEKKYAGFLFQIMIATMMDYKYVTASFKNRLKLSRKLNLFSKHDK